MGLGGVWCSEGDEAGGDQCLLKVSPLTSPPFPSSPECFRPCTAIFGGNDCGSRQTSPGLTWRTGMGEFMPKPLTCTSPSPWPCSSSLCGTSLRRESLPWGSWAPHLPLPVPWGLWPSPGMWHLVLSPAGGPRGPLGVPIPPPQPHGAPLSPHKQGFVHPPPSPGLQGGICWANNGNRPGFVGMARERGGGIALQPSGDSP